tara:strand:- start:287 stop:451 length:165 start_codon:yes stop_codon:yes gene_type:complete
MVVIQVFQRHQPKVVAVVVEKLEIQLQMEDQVDLAVVVEEVLEQEVEAQVIVHL